MENSNRKQCFFVYFFVTLSILISIATVFSAWSSIGFKSYFMPFGVFGLIPYIIIVLAALLLPVIHHSLLYSSSGPTICAFVTFVCLITFSFVLSHFASLVQNVAICKLTDAKNFNIIIIDKLNSFLKEPKTSVLVFTTAGIWNAARASTANDFRKEFPATSDKLEITTILNKHGIIGNFKDGFVVDPGKKSNACYNKLKHWKVCKTISEILPGLLIHVPIKDISSVPYFPEITSKACKLSIWKNHFFTCSFEFGI